MCAPQDPPRGRGARGDWHAGELHTQDAAAAPVGGVRGGCPRVCGYIVVVILAMRRKIIQK